MPLSIYLMEMERWDRHTPISNNNVTLASELVSYSDIGKLVVIVLYLL